MSRRISPAAITPVVLAGGSGTRLWPLSRELYPKQFLPLVGARTLLQNTILRLAGLDGVDGPIVICNDHHRFLVAEQLRAVNIKPASILLEPMGRNTAPAVVLGALDALSRNPDAILLVLPADHHMPGSDAFTRAMMLGLEAAQRGHLITFGVLPTQPETGYGYIEKGDPLPLDEGDSQVLRISRFVEKPDSDTARKYLESGKYLWNSGIFMFGAARIIEEMKRLAPEIIAACELAYNGGLSDLDFFRLDAGAFSESPNISLDYAVMEKTDRGVVIPLSENWSDLGSWSAIWDVQGKDAEGNVTTGDVITHQVEDCYIHSTERLVAALGVRNLVIVETADAVLVAGRDDVQEIKTLVQALKARSREEALIHREVFRPWGSYEGLVVGDRFQVKCIRVKPGEKLSLQKHHHRAEHWVVVRGTALVTRDGETFLLKEDESTYIPIGVNHRLENPGKITLELIEVQTGSYLGEDDIVRFEDVYARIR